MKKLFPIVLLMMTTLVGQAAAQSTPGLYPGQIPTAAQWNAWFGGKQDYLGYIPLSPTGAVMTGRFVTAAPTSLLAGFNLTPGSTPSAPANGDVWATSSGLYARINGSTIGPLGAAGITALTGDGTATGPGSAAFTLATVNANVGTFGSTTKCTTATANAKGLITAISEATCAPAISSVSGLGANIASALATNIGSPGAPVVFNGAGGTPSSMVGTNITGTASGLTAGSLTNIASLLTAGRGITLSGTSNATIAATAGGVYQAGPAAPTGTGSGSAVMMGLGCSITPSYSSRFRVIVNGNQSNSIAGAASFVQIRYGTGTAPTNGAAATGTALGTVSAYNSPSAAYAAPFAPGGIVTGATPGVTYWFDLSVFQFGGGIATTASVTCSAFEL